MGGKLIIATAKLAYLVQPKIVNGVEGEAIVEFREHEIPTPGPGEILVKVEGTGEVVAIGEGVTTDTKGDPIKVGDKVVTSVLLCGECDYCRRYPELPNLCENLGVYGLINEDDVHFNGWFAEYILVRKNSSIFVVNGMSVDERMLIEPLCVTVHSWNRAKSTNIINFGSTVLVQGCGPIGLSQIAVLKAADAYKYIRRGGGYCELGFFVNAGDCTMNPHFDLCNKEITLVGSWVYSANEYIETLGFIKKAKEMGIPVEKLVTHHYPLEQYVDAMEKNISLEGVKIAIVME